MRTLSPLSNLDLITFDMHARSPAQWPAQPLCLHHPLRRPLVRVLPELGQTNLFLHKFPRGRRRNSEGNAVWDNVSFGFGRFFASIFNQKAASAFHIFDRFASAPRCRAPGDRIVASWREHNVN
jgi:hypothetical protein